MTNKTTPIINSKMLREYKKKYNFFETPKKLAQKAAQLLDVQYGSIILEPSAGTGSLLHSCRKILHESVKYHYCEVQEEFTPFLSEFKRVGDDFLKYRPAILYDAVIMNPPYKNSSAEKHIDHAWDCLNPGGKIVAIVGLSALSYIEEEYQGYIYHNEKFTKAFSETSIDTFLLLIHKPLNN